MSQDYYDDSNIIDVEYEVVDEGPARRSSYKPYVTYILIASNILVWILMNLFGLFAGWNQNIQLLYFGAKINELIALGQYWRLFTAMFLHVGILHLFFNAYALYLYGPIVERLFGRHKFVIIYIAAGLMGSVFSFILSPNPAAGASGAIFGLMGALLYFRKHYRKIYQSLFGPNLLIIIGINLVFGFIQPGIDNWGHIGGLVGGFLASNGLGLYESRENNIFMKLVFWFILLLIFALGIGYGSFKYRKLMGLV